MQYKYKLEREIVNLLIKIKKIVLRVDPFYDSPFPHIKRQEFIDKINEEITAHYSHLNNPKRFK
jgi:hypothetical protein